MLFKLCDELAGENCQTEANANGMVFFYGTSREGVLLEGLLCMVLWHGFVVWVAVGFGCRLKIVGWGLDCGVGWMVVITWLLGVSMGVSGYCVEGYGS